MAHSLETPRFWNVHREADGRRQATVQARFRIQRAPVLETLLLDFAGDAAFQASDVLLFLALEVALLPLQLRVSFGVGDVLVIAPDGMNLRT